MKKLLLVCSVLAGLVVGNTAAQATDAEVMTTGTSGIPVPWPTDSKGMPLVDTALPSAILTPGSYIPTTTIATGGAVINITGSFSLNTIHQCYLQNPLSAVMENIATAESLFISIDNISPVPGNGDTIELQPGGSFTTPPGMSTSIKGVAATTGHKFTGVCW